MKLAELYSTYTGLKIGKQFLLEKYFPVPTNKKYIIVQNSSGMPGKNYPYYNEVIDLIFPILHANNIDIIQLGIKEDQPLKKCINLQGQTSIHQTNYILARSIAFFGNDSFMQHRAGELNIPTTVVFGTTDKEVHSSYKFHPNSQFISAHRWGKNPSFLSQENPQSIATIKPEEIAEAIFRTLGVLIKFNHKTLFIGSLYNQKTIEWVPNFILPNNWLDNQTLIVRCDYTNHEYYQNILINELQKRQLYIITDKEIDIERLKPFKKNIALFILKINENINIEYIKQLKYSGIKTKLTSETIDNDKLSELRLKYFDFFAIEQVILRNIEDFWIESEKYNNFKLDKETTFLQNGLELKTNKFIVSDGKIFPSKLHLNINQPIESFEKNTIKFINNDELWKDLDYLYLYGTK